MPNNDDDNNDNVPAILPLALMQSLVPDASIRREYEQAHEAVPDLVATESKFLHFVQTESYDYPKAALRLAYYWKYRKHVFGSDRWLLPLTQTGTGALSMEDVEILRTGYYVNIDRRSTHQPLLAMVDLSRLGTRSFGASEIRLVFYFTALLSDDHFLSRTIGLTLLHLVHSSGPRPPVSVDVDHFRMLHTGMPLRLKEILVLCAYEDYREILLETLADQQSTVTKFRTGFRQAPISRGNSVGHTLRLIEGKGIDRKYLPTQIYGGSFDYNEFYDWIRARISVENLMGAAPLMANTRLASTVMAQPPTSAVAAASAGPPQQGRLRPSRIQLLADNVDQPRNDDNNYWQEEYHNTMLGSARKFSFTSAATSISLNTVNFEWDNDDCNDLIQPIAIFQGPRIEYNNTDTDSILPLEQPAPLPPPDQVSAPPPPVHQATATSTITPTPTSTANSSTTSAVAARLPTAAYHHRRHHSTRQILKVAALQQEVEDWKTRNDKLRSENRTLQAHLAQARLVVAMHLSQT